MQTVEDPAVRRFRESLDEEYARRFPRSKAWHERAGTSLLDGTSHAIRSNEPFMPIARRASGACFEDLDGHRILDYWQGHFANLLGHNPPLVRQALTEALAEGRGLQTGLLHEVEAEVAALVCRRTGMETLRFTTSGSLGTFYAALLARAFTGRDRVLKVAGGWHGSQPFGLMGVSARGTSFDHLESEGLSASAGAEILLTRFNDIEDLRGTFRRDGDRIACFLIEPILGSGGGMAARREYLHEARSLTEKHGALLLCDEIITGFRFRAGDLSSAYGVRPDLLILGKILGGGMPVAALAGRRDVLRLCSIGSGRVKFEGGTYSAHELSLIAARTLLVHLVDHEDEVYARLSALGARLRAELMRRVEAEGIAAHVLGEPDPSTVKGGSLAFLHLLREGSPPPACPEDLAATVHPRVGERLLKALLILQDLSVRSGLGAISTEHTEADLTRTVESFGAAVRRLRHEGLL